MLGVIRNVRFENINCRSENGILVFGKSNAHICDIFFSNVSVELYRKTDWPCFVHDLRPTCGEKQVDYTPCYFYAQGASGIQVSKLRMVADETVAAEMPEKYCAFDCPGFSLDDR